MYVFVNKKVSTRFFEIDGDKVKNPGPGTVVEKGIVKPGNNEKLFDFYMISNNNPKTATALPVHYEIVHNSTNLSKIDI